MKKIIDYATPEQRTPSRVLAVCADITLAYPVLMVGLLYAEWFLAWFMLGHAPVPSMDDPKSIPGSSWMHDVVGLGFIGVFPAIVAALVFNILFVTDRRPRLRRLVVRLMVALILWVGPIAFLFADPFRALYWWVD